MTIIWDTLNYFQLDGLILCFRYSELYNIVTILLKIYVYNCKLLNDYICNSIKFRNAIRADK